MVRLTISRSLDGESVKIIIGSESDGAVSFDVNKKVLCRFPYFEKALCGGFSEAAKGVLRFPEDNVVGWKVLLYYFFNDRLPNHNDIMIATAEEQGWDEVDEGADHELSSYSVALAHAYQLADQYGLATVQNCIMRTFMDIHSSNIRYCYGRGEELAEIVGFLPDVSKLREVALQQIIVRHVEDGLEWDDVRSLGEHYQDFGDFADYLSEYFIATLERKEKYPKHEYGKNKKETAEYMVKE